MAAQKLAPLTSRPMDLIAVLWFVMHIPTTLIIDVQSSESEAEGGC